MSYSNLGASLSLTSPSALKTSSVSAKVAAPAVDGGVPVSLVTSLADFLTFLFDSGNKNPQMIQFALSAIMLKQAADRSRGAPVPSAKVVDALSRLSPTDRDFVARSLSAYASQGQATAAALRGATVQSVLDDIAAGKYLAKPATVSFTRTPVQMTTGALTPTVPAVTPSTEQVTQDTQVVQEAQSAQERAAAEAARIQAEMEMVRDLRPYGPAPIEATPGTVGIATPGLDASARRKKIAIAAVAILAIGGVAFALRRPKAVTANRRKR